MQPQTSKNYIFVHKLESISNNCLVCTPVPYLPHLFQGVSASDLLTKMVSLTPTQDPGTNFFDWWTNSTLHDVSALTFIERLHWNQQNFIESIGQLVQIPLENLCISIYRRTTIHPRNQTNRWPCPDHTDSRILAIDVYCHCVWLGLRTSLCCQSNWSCVV